MLESCSTNKHRFVKNVTMPRLKKVVGINTLRPKNN